MSPVRGALNYLWSFDKHFHPLNVRHTFQPSHVMCDQILIFLEQLCIPNRHRFWDWTFSLSFPKLVTIRGVPRCRPMRWTRCQPTAIGRLKTNCRSIFDILSLNVHLSKEVFFFLSQMLVYFPLNTIFFFMWQTSQLSDILQSQKLVMNFYSLWLLFKN